MKRSINKTFLALVLITIIIPFQSCKGVAKKVAKESTERIAKFGAEKFAKETGERSLREIGEKAVKDFPWDEVLKALERDNPLLGKGLKKLSKSFRKGLAHSIQYDHRVYSTVLSTPTILDDFKVFVKEDSQLSNDLDLFFMVRAF